MAISDQMSFFVYMYYAHGGNSTFCLFVLLIIWSKIVYSDNTEFIFAFFQVIDAFKKDERSSRTKLDKALVADREHKHETPAQIERNKRLIILCQDINDGTKNMKRFLAGVAEVIRPTKSNE